MDLNLNDMTMTKALLKIEKMNHDAVDSLVKKVIPRLNLCIVL